MIPGHYHTVGVWIKTRSSLARKKRVHHDPDVASDIIQTPEDLSSLLDVKSHQELWDGAFDSYSLQLANRSF